MIRQRDNAARSAFNSFIALNHCALGDRGRLAWGLRANRLNDSRRRLEQIPKKLTDLFDENLLQPFDAERFLIARMIPCQRKALWTVVDMSLSPKNCLAEGPFLAGFIDLKTR